MSMTLDDDFKRIGKIVKVVERLETQSDAYQALIGEVNSTFTEEDEEGGILSSLLGSLTSLQDQYLDSRSAFVSDATDYIETVLAETISSPAGSSSEVLTDLKDYMDDEGYKIYGNNYRTTYLYGDVDNVGDTYYGLGVDEVGQLTRYGEKFVVECTDDSTEFAETWSITSDTRGTLSSEATVGTEFDAEGLKFTLPSNPYGTNPNTEAADYVGDQTPRQLLNFDLDGVDETNAYGNLADGVMLYGDLHLVQTGPSGAPGRVYGDGTPAGCRDWYLDADNFEPQSDDGLYYVNVEYLGGNYGVRVYSDADRTNLVGKGDQHKDYTSSPFMTIRYDDPTYGWIDADGTGKPYGNVTIEGATGNESNGFVYAFGYHCSLKKNNTQSYDDLVARGFSGYGSEVYGGVFTMGEKNDSGVSGTVDFGYQSEQTDIKIHLPQRHKAGDRMAVETSVDNATPSGVAGTGEMKFMKFFRENFDLALPHSAYGDLSTDPVVSGQFFPEDYTE